MSAWFRSLRPGFREDFQDAAEPRDVLGAGLTEGLVSFLDNGAPGHGAGGGGGDGIACQGRNQAAFLGPEVAIDVHAEDVVETEFPQGIEVAGPGVEDVQGAAGFLAETEGDSGEGAHEGGVHAQAAFQVNDDAASSGGDEMIHEGAEIGAAFDTTPLAHADPDDVFEESDR